MGVGGDAKQIANDGLRLGVVVDVTNDIANTVKDNQVGLVDEYGGLDQLESLLPVGYSLSLSFQRDIFYCYFLTSLGLTPNWFLT